MNPITYTTKARVIGLDTSGGSFRSFDPIVEVHLRSDIGSPITLFGTLGFTVLPADLPVDRVDSILNTEVEVTVRLLTKRTKVVPWTAEEVPVGCLVRKVGNRPFRWVLTMVNEAVAFCGNITFPLTNLASEYEHSTDNGKTWRAAGRVEEVYE